MKKLGLFVLSLYFAVFAAIFGSAATLDGNTGVSGMQISADAVVVMEAMTGRVLFAQNENERLPVASTTKIMTSLITLEQPDIDAVFTVDENAIMVEGSSMGLRKGDKASLRALAAGMLLPSGNDAANAAAVRIAGSIPAFAKMMNDRANELGLADTSFETPSGLDAKNHYSTASDMAMLTRAALQNNEFSEICSQYKLRTSFGDPPYERWLTNHNKLLNYRDDVIGVKTGFTKKAGRCLVSAARRNGVELICVTLNCSNDWKVHQELYDRYFEKVQVEDLSKGIPELKVPVTGGVRPYIEAVKSETAQVPLPTEGADIEYKITVEQFVYAPVRKGQYLGEAKVLVDGVETFRITLTAGNGVGLLNEYKEEISFIDILRGIFNRKD